MVGCWRRWRRVGRGVRFPSSQAPVLNRQCHPDLVVFLSLMRFLFFLSGFFFGNALPSRLVVLRRSFAFPVTFLKEVTPSFGVFSFGVPAQAINRSRRGTSSEKSSGGLHSATASYLFCLLLSNRIS